MALGDVLPTVNAGLNATSAVLLLLGRRAIKRGDRMRHRAIMLTAVTVSTVFLVSYLVRVKLTGTHRYAGTPTMRSLYLLVLSTHMVLAMAVPFLVARLIFLATRERFDAHKRLARWTFPIWLYVSVTGVVVYAMLYH